MKIAGNKIHTQNWSFAIFKKKNWLTRFGALYTQTSQLLQYGHNHLGAKFTLHLADDLSGYRLWVMNNNSKAFLKINFVGQLKNWPHIK